MTFEYPDYFARFYDVIYHSIRDGTDNHYYLQKIKEVEGKVLEIGAGTGRFFIRALKDGADIYAIDVSSSMIDVLKSKIDSAYHYRVSLQNAVDFKLEHKFSLIIAPFRVFSHLIATSEQIAAFNNIYDHLCDGGIFIFDLYVPDLKLLIEGISNYTDFEKEYTPGEKVRRIITTQNDLINQLTHIRFRIEWTENGQWIGRDWDFDFRYYFRYEIEHLAAISKFKSCTIYGDFNENSLTRNSKEFIVHCRK